MDKAIRATIKKRKDFYRDYCFGDYCFKITNAYFVYHKPTSNVSIGRRMFEWGTPFPSIRELLDRVG